MESGWWTVRRWPASRPSASPQLLPQFSVWPGFHQHQECSSLEVKKKKEKKSASPGVFEPSGVFYHKVVKEPFEVLSVCVCLRSRFSFACGDIFQEKKKIGSWDSLLWVRVRIRINPKGLHLKRSSHLCVCVCVRFSGGSSAGVERLTFHSIGQLQTEKEWISCLTCHQLTPGQERWNCFESSTKTRCFWFQPPGFTDQFWSDLWFRFVALKVSDIKAFLEFHS